MYLRIGSNWRSLMVTKIKLLTYADHQQFGVLTTAWRVFRLWMEERPPDMESSCEYPE
jgi:hypothetical protein